MRLVSAIGFTLAVTIILNVIYTYNGTVVDNFAFTVSLTILLLVSLVVSLGFLVRIISRKNTPPKQDQFHASVGTEVSSRTETIRDMLRSPVSTIILSLITFFNAKFGKELTYRPATAMRREAYRLTLPAKARKAQTVIGLVVLRNAQNVLSTYGLLFAALLLYLIFSPEINLIVVGILLVFLLALFINQKALEYRVKYGFYGTNTQEAREILTFILHHSDRSDLTGGGGDFRKLFPEPEPLPEQDLGAEGARGAL